MLRKSKRYLHGSALHQHRGNILAVNTAKDEVRKLLDRLPDETSFEEIQYQVYVLDEISRGADEIDRGDGVAHAEVKRRLAKWLEK